MWIYPRGQSLTFLEDATGDHTVVDTALHTEPEKRAQAYERIIQRPELLSPELLLDGLADRDADVRLRVISQAMRTYVELPADTLEDLALVNSNARVRLAALSALSSHPTIDTSAMESIAHQASQDPDPAVQSQAMELLAHLEAVQAGESVDDVEFQNVNRDETVDAGNMAVPSEPVVQ
ncbi:hypothetical protein C2W62_21115 [Candidatus Entotheonella serta]|nr:hypothetical protein C2W62_21115 [Candidatus Entotheonella serta]